MNDLNHSRLFSARLFAAGLLLTSAGSASAMMRTGARQGQPPFVKLTRLFTMIGFVALAGTAGLAQSVFSLFDGTNTIQWVPASTGFGPILWTVADGALQVAPGRGAIETFQYFQDFELHVEFRSPSTPDGTPEQSRGNSGIYLQNRYEIQILDSYNWPISGLNDCAAIYNFRNADTNVARPAGEWQTYEILFRAARWNGATKLESARACP